MSKEVSEETKKVLKGLKTEITAGMTLSQKTDIDKAWNDAHQRCLRLIAMYERGEGLLQE